MNPSRLMTGILVCAALSHAGIFLNVRDYAKGTGADADRVQIQNALNDASTKGGGTVYMPAGTYTLNCVVETGVRIYSLLIPSNIKLMGDGMGATKLLVAPNLPLVSSQECRVLANKNQTAAKGDSLITFEDFSIDGNAATQTAHSMSGISLAFTQKVQHNRVLIRNIKGTQQYEGAAFDVHYSSHLGYTDCEATTTQPGTYFTGTGFGITSSTGVEYKGCRASRSTSWQGFTTMSSRHVTYVNCHAYRNRLRGFNSERSVDVQYMNCTSGGKSSSIKYWPNMPSYPYNKPDSSLGNYDQGFVAFQSENVLLSNCIAEDNVVHGLYTDGTTNLRVVGGVFTGNGTSGNAGLNPCQMFFQNAVDARNTRITGGPVFAAGQCQVRIVDEGGGAARSYPAMGYVPAPKLPWSGYQVINPYPFDATVYVFGPGITAISLQGQNIPFLQQPGSSIRVPAGAGIQVYIAPGGSWDWTWFVD